MLIAFALVVSGIFYSWVSQFSYSQREEFQFCSKAQITMQKAYYSNETGNINMMVYNAGSVPLKGFTVIISKEKTTSTSNFAGKEIESRETGLFPVKYEKDIRTIVVQSVECKNAQDMITVYDVEGLQGGG